MMLIQLIKNALYGRFLLVELVILATAATATATCR